jgi:glycosyltransferase involved in cell wall biosynthesis
MQIQHELGDWTRLHILIATTFYPSPGRPSFLGGAEIVVKRYAEALLAEGARVSIVRAVPPGEPVPAETVDGMSIYSIPIRRAYWPFDGEKRSAIAKLRWHAAEDFGEVKELIHLLDTIRPTLLHSHNIAGLSTGVWRAAARAHIPIVHTLHDYYLLCLKTTRFRSGSRCQRICADCRLLTTRRRIDSNRIGDIVGVSRAVLGEHRDNGLFDGVRQHCIPNIIEMDLKPTPLSSGRPVTFGFLGRPTVEKGVLELARAFGQMQTKARLVMGGRVDEQTRREAQKEAGDRAIEFPGFVELDTFFHNIDVLVVPSIWSDPFPSVILEAQKAGRPTLGSSYGGISEAIGSDAAGWTFDPSTPDALRKMLDEIASNREIIIAKSSEAPLQSGRFTRETILGQYRSLYAQALAR